MELAEIERIKSIPMFFIAGMGRSGTTLLQSLLDANAGILIPFESRLIITLNGKYAKVKHWSKSKILEFHNDLFCDAKYKTLWKVDHEKLKKDLLSVQESATFPLLCKIV